MVFSIGVEPARPSLSGRQAGFFNVRGVVIGAKSFKIVVAEDLVDLSRRSAEFVAQHLIKRAKVKNRLSVVLSGGETPRGLYRLLASDEVGKNIPWRKVHLFWGDERCVSPQHRESNYRLAYEALISRIPIPFENVHPMMEDDIDPQKAAEAYEKNLRDFFGHSARSWPRFDLVILGIGIDGHTASLFAGGSALKEKKRWVAAPYVEKMKAYRLTLTVPVFNHADQVIFLAAGVEKARVLKEGFLKSAKPRFPYQLIKPRHGRVVFFLDAAVAGLMGPLNRLPGKE